MKTRVLAGCILALLFTTFTKAGEFSVSTNSYLGGPGNLEEIRGARVQSDGTIVLGAVIGSAAPGGLTPLLLNGADSLTPAAVVRLSQDGQTVLSVTRLADEIWDLSVDGTDHIYVAAGAEGLIKLDPTGSSIVFQKRAGNHVYRVDAAPNGDVACLQPEFSGPGSNGARTEDNTPGIATIHAYDAGGTEITHFDTWGGRHAVDVAIYDGNGTTADARIMVVGWRNGYAYTGPLDACNDNLVDGLTTTVHIGSIFGFSYAYDGTNDETDLVYHMYDRGERRTSIWLPTAPATIKDRRQEHLNLEFFNGPTNLTNLYTIEEINAARTDGINWNDWLWVEEDAGNSFVGCPENLIYQEAFDWYQKGFPDSPEYIDDSYRYPNWCPARNKDGFVGYPYITGGNNMADTRGLRLSMGRDGKLYALFENAGGNNEIRFDPFDLTVNAPDAPGDVFHQFLNLGSAHALTIGRYEPVDGSVLMTQQYASNYKKGTGQTVSNTTRGKAGDIAADERGRVYFVGVSAGELPIPLAANYNNTPAFNPYPEGYYMGGAHLIVLRPDMSGREYATRLAFGYTHAVDARILGADPLTDPATIVFAGKDGLGSPLWTLNPVQPNPGYGTQDGYFAVLGGTGTTGGETYSITVGDDDWPSSSYSLNFRGTNQVNSTIDGDNDGSVDDRRSAWDFSDTIPLSDGSPDYTGLPFYGGFELVKMNSSSSNLFGSSRTGIKTDGLGHGTSSAVGNANFLVYFDKADLPGINADDRLSFGRSSRPSVLARQNRQWQNSRFVVRDGSQFYLSEDVSSDFQRVMNFPTDNDDGRWTEWDPATSLEFDQSSAVYANRNFQNITGFGFYSDRDSSANNIGLYTRLTDFLLEFTVNAVGSSSPVAVASAAPQLVAVGDTVALDGTASSDPDGAVSFFAWELNDDDDNSSSGPVATHVYPAPGNYKPALTVYDSNLNSDTAAAPVWVGPVASRGADLSRVFAAFDGVKGKQDWRKQTVSGIDLDGDLDDDDGWTGAPFSESDPLETRLSTSLYGGVIMKGYNSGRARMEELRWDGDDITIRTRDDQSRAPDWAYELHGAMFIDKSDFLRGGEDGTVSMDATASIETKFGRNSGWIYRWLIRNGSTYYLSEDTFTAAQTVHRYMFSSGGNWAPYDPATDLNFDQGAAVFSPQSFNDVTGVGMYVEREPAGPGWNFMEIKYLIAEGAVTPFVNTPPVASFSTAPANPTAPVIVTLDASSSSDDAGITSVHWDFGDGSFSKSVGTTGSPPVFTVDHAYPEAGDYRVTLTVTDTHGVSDTQVQVLSIAGPTPTRARVSAVPQSGSIPLSVSFDGSASTAVSGRTIVAYDWNFGDGSTGTGLAPSHTYTGTGTFVASLTVTDSSGEFDTANAYVTVDLVDPVAAFSASTLTAAPGLAVLFDASTSLPGAGTLEDFIWNFGDGQGSAGVTTSHAFQELGSYPVSLTVINSDGAVDTTSVLLEVTHNAPPVASLTAAPQAGFLPLEVTFNAGGSSDSDGTIDRYDWDFGDGTVITDGGSSPVHTYTESGDFTATVTVSDDDGSTDSEAATITVYLIPSVAISRDGTHWLISVPTIPGYLYQLRSGTGMSTPPGTWDPVGVAVSGDGSIHEFQVLMSTWPADPQRFFVIEILPE